MQYALTSAIEFVFVSSVVFFASQFVLGLVKRHRPQPVTPITQTEPEFVPNPDGFAEATTEEADLVEWHQKFVALHWAKLPTNNVVRFERKNAVLVDWNSLDSFQLRAECSLRGIRWRDVNGKHRHMSKAEMVQRLSA